VRVAKVESSGSGNSSEHSDDCSVVCVSCSSHACLNQATCSNETSTKESKFSRTTPVQRNRQNRDTKDCDGFGSNLDATAGVASSRGSPPGSPDSGPGLAAQPVQVRANGANPGGAKKDGKKNLASEESNELASQCPHLAGCMQTNLAICPIRVDRILTTKKLSTSRYAMRHGLTAASSPCHSHLTGSSLSANDILGSQPSANQDLIPFPVPGLLRGSVPLFFSGGPAMAVLDEVVK
jgi:hypothetical protein